VSRQLDLISWEPHNMTSERTGSKLFNPGCIGSFLVAWVRSAILGLGLSLENFL